MLNDALRYLKLGWSVIPACWPVDGKCGCGRGHVENQVGKAPLLPTWRVYQSRLPTTEEVTRWWTDAPLANIACITGAISKMAVVDLEYEGLAEAERLCLTSGLISQTGKGRHLIYSHPGEKVCGTTKLNGIRGFDIRGDGNYIILPPSMHASGKRYRWITPVFGAGAFSPFPAALLKSQTPSGATAYHASKPQGWIAEALGGLSNGNRNNVFAQVVGKLHGQRWSSSDIRCLLLPHALRVEFPENELETVIRSVTRYPVEIRGGRAIQPNDGQPAAKLSIRTFAGDWTDYEKRRSGAKNTEYATGYPRFDALLNGGLVRERLLTVAARTGVGKTNWLLGMCRSLCLRDKRVLYLSTELSYKKIWDRFIPLFGSEAEARKCRLEVSDESIPHPDAIRAAILEHKPDVFIFDHIHNVSEENSEVGNYIKALHDCAKDFQIPGVVAAQLNKNAYFIDRETGKRVTPHMGMIKGASAIIQISGQVLVMDEVDETPEQRDVIGVLDKNSDGEKGVVSFVLKKNPYRMVEA